MTTQKTNPDDRSERRHESTDNAEANLNDQDPGERQKENQNQQKDDPLAA
jgi:hypothetical protein